MILAINVNAALDRIFFIDRFAPNTHMRSSKAVLSVGGKGLDTALVLKTLDAPVCALSFIAGKNGKILEELLNKHQITTKFIWLPGETRESIVIVETDLNRHSHVTTSGYTLTEDSIRTFFEKLTELAPKADWAILAGSLPGGASPTLYRELIECLHQHHVKTLIDGFGAPILQTLPAHPEIVKMNQHEFQETFEVQACDFTELILCCKTQMQIHDIQNLVITCGKDGILALTQDGVFHAGCTEVKEVNAAGAGDAVSAALSYRLSLGDSWPQALIWAAATSAAVVITEGTAESYIKDINDFYPIAWVKQIEHI